MPGTPADRRTGAAVTSERGQAAGRPAAAPGARTRVLIVEDEPTLVRALRIDLRARGYEVLTAATGRDALEQAARRPPDAVLLDLGLPDRDGTDVVRQLRGWSSAPVIVLSGRSSPQDKIGALDAGADDYVTKPFSTEELVARLRAVLRRGEAVRPSGMVVIGHCLVSLDAHLVTRQPGTGPGDAGADGTRDGDAEPEPV